MPLATANSAHALFPAGALIAASLQTPAEAVSAKEIPKITARRNFMMAPEE